MAQRFGEFFLEPEWPIENQNGIELANLYHDSSSETIHCKYEQPIPQFVKYEQDHQNAMQAQENEKKQKYKIYVQQKQIVIKKEEEDSDYSGQSSQYQAQQDSHSANISKKQNLAMEKIKKEPNQQIITLKLEKFTRSPLKNLLKKKKKKDFERGRYNILSEELKKQIVQECKNMTMVEVSRKYHVSVNNICRWRKRCDRRSGAGRKVTDMCMQRKLLTWILNQNQPIPRKQVQIMAKAFSGQQQFKASKGWFERFYKRNKLEYHPNVQILTFNDYRQRVTHQQLQEKLIKIKLESLEQSVQPEVKLEHNFETNTKLKIEQQ